MTDVLPSGFRLIEPPAVTWEPANALTPAGIDTTRSTSRTVLETSSRVPSGTVVTIAMTAVAENIAANQAGVQYTNTATLGWHDLGGTAVSLLTSAPVTTTLVGAAPDRGKGSGAQRCAARRHGVLPYNGVYHAPTSTPGGGYNVVQISDIGAPPKCATSVVRGRE